MNATMTRYEHIVIRDDGTAVVAGTTMKVRQLVAEKMAYGWSPEELHHQHPGLSLGQIHSALAYYWDHRESVDREIQDELKRVERMRAEAEPPPFVERWRTRPLP